jgi:hypothetical protein
VTSRFAVVIVASFSLAGCAGWVRLKAYDGPELPITDVAIIRTRIPSPGGIYDVGAVQVVAQEGRTYYRYFDDRYKLPEYTSFLELVLQPGDYDITLVGACRHGGYADHEFRVTLQSGRMYEVKRAGCFSLFEDGIRLWIEDVATGDDVSHSKDLLLDLRPRWTGPLTG